MRYKVPKSTILTPNYSIVFIHFYSASHSMNLSEALPTTAFETVSCKHKRKRYRQL